MKIAIDIDGTIDTSKHLWNMVKDNEVYFLTTKRKSKEERKRQLQDLGITNYRDIIIVEGSTKAWIGANKGTICKELGIDVLFENDGEVIYWVKEMNMTTECFLLL